jgi:hypothetical protein
MHLLGLVAPEHHFLAAKLCTYQGGDGLPPNLRAN